MHSPQRLRAVQFARAGAWQRARAGVSPLSRASTHRGSTTIALFQALRTRHDADSHGGKWPESLATRDRETLVAAARDFSQEIAYRQVRAVACGRAVDVRQARVDPPLQIFGDVPFMISADSPDVWTRQDEFRFDATVGVPPDAFSETGQDWGLPPWRWEVMAANDFRVDPRARATDRAIIRRLSPRPSCRSVPHLHTVRSTRRRTPFFAPPDPAGATRARRAPGRRCICDTGAEIIAEDLGTVPGFVRASLRRLRVPGFKVMRWERRWSEPEKPYVDPSPYEEMSVATTGTHDTEPLATLVGIAFGGGARRGRQPAGGSSAPGPGLPRHSTPSSLRCWIRVPSLRLCRCRMCSVGAIGSTHRPRQRRQLELGTALARRPPGRRRRSTRPSRTLALDSQRLRSRAAAAIAAGLSV